MSTTTTTVTTQDVIPKVILFVSADADNKLDEQAEFEAVKDAISRSAAHRVWNVIHIPSCTSYVFCSALLYYRPTILHFSGHGNTEGIYFQDIRLGWRVLAYILDRAAGDRFCSVILSACDSEAHSVFLAEAVGIVVAMEGTVREHASIAFSTIFYRQLGDGKSFQEAFNAATAPGSGLSSYDNDVVPHMAIASWL